MGCFGGPTPKRHLILSNDARLIKSLEGRGGYLPKAKREQLQGGPLVTRHMDRRGILRTTGIKKKLKQSQCLGFGFSRLALGRTRWNLDTLWRRFSRL